MQSFPTFRSRVSEKSFQDKRIKGTKLDVQHNREVMYMTIFDIAL